MSEIGKVEVQKMYDAQKEITKEKDPFAALNPETGNFFFKNEYERKMFLVGLEASKVDAAIRAVTEDKVWLSDIEKSDYFKELKKLKDGLEDTKRMTRSSLRNEALVIDATIPGPKWEKSGNEVSVEGKKYGVEKREWSEKGKSDLKIDAGLTASVLVKDVPDDKIDAVLKSYEAANTKDAKDGPLKSGMFGKTVKYEEISKSLVVTPAQTAEVFNKVIDLNKEGWTLNKDNKLEKDGKLFSGKGKFVKEGEKGYTAEWIHKDGVFIDGTMKYQDRVRSGKFDPNTGKLIDGYVQWNNSKRRVEGKSFDKDTGYLLDGTFINEDWTKFVWTWNNKGENFSGTRTAIDGKVTTWKDGKEVIVEKNIADILKDVQAPKGYTLSYDEWKKQVQLKKGEKVVGYFTPGNKENTDKADAVGIQKWVDTKIQKIQDAVDVKNPDMFENASDVLKIINTIKGLEKVKTLKELGFMRDKAWLIPPEWLSWEDVDAEDNWNMKLKDGYIVYNGKVVKIWGR